MIQGAEIEAGPFWKQAITGPQRRKMHRQQSFQLAPAILEPEQLGSEFITATVVADKIAPALFAFKDRDRGKGRLTIYTDPGHIHPKG